MKLEPITPRLEYLCRGEVFLSDVVKAGTVPYGERRIVPFTGGRFEGELSGEVLPGGADTQWIRPDGTAIVDAKYMVQTPEGAIVHIHNHGLRAITLDVVDRIDRGENVEPTSYYFRTTPMFDTGSPKYAWLNNVVGVCSGVRLANTALLDFYVVR